MSRTPTAIVLVCPAFELGEPKGIMLYGVVASALYIILEILLPAIFTIFVAYAGSMVKRKVIGVRGV